MFLIVGLGNPGKEYENTPHNAGFMALDAIAKNFQFPIFNFQSISNAQISKGQIGEQKIILAKPQTFMNNSGKAVRSFLPRPGLGVPRPGLGTAPQLIVVHDDIDIPLGKIKISKGSGSAGHKGVDSIIQSLGTKDFTRVRIGIQPATGKPENVEDFVLQKFSKEERDILDGVLEKSCKAITMILTENPEKTAGGHNT